MIVEKLFICLHSIFEYFLQFRLYFWFNFLLNYFLIFKLMGWCYYSQICSDFLKGILNFTNDFFFRERSRSKSQILFVLFNANLIDAIFFFLSLIQGNNSFLLQKSNLEIYRKVAKYFLGIVNMPNILIFCIYCLPWKPIISNMFKLVHTG